jgi:hypothetical protein
MYNKDDYRNSEFSLGHTVLGVLAVVGVVAAVAAGGGEGVATSTRTRGGITFNRAVNGFAATPPMDNLCTRRAVQISQWLITGQTPEAVVYVM